MTNNYSTKTIAAAFVLAAGSFSLSATSLASSHEHEELTGIYKDRHDTMEAFGGFAKMTGAMFKGATPMDLAKIQEGAAMVAEKSGSIPDLFPEGTNAAPSEALPIIWQDWDGFVAASKLLGERAGGLAAAGDPAAAGAAFGAMIKACGGCHETYRLKKD